MPFVEIAKRRSLTKREMFPDCVYVTNKCLRFSVEFWREKIKGAPSVRLFFDERTNEVGILPSFSNHEGYKICSTKEHPTPMVNWKNFVEQVKLNFEKRSSFKIVPGGDVLGSPEKMMVFSVVNGKELS
jgi:hypothetical protein